MTDQEITKGNILIAQFMGWEISNKGKKFKSYLPPYGYNKAHPNFLKFHILWDWLMPVVEKIENIGETNKTYGIICTITNSHIQIGKIILENKDKVYSTKIEGVYKAIVKFIKWYNERSKT